MHTGDIPLDLHTKKDNPTSILHSQTETQMSSKTEKEIPGLFPIYSFVIVYSKLCLLNICVTLTFKLITTNILVRVILLFTNVVIASTCLNRLHNRVVD